LRGGNLKTMKRIAIDGLHLWQFDRMASAPGIRHFVTDRNSLINGNEFTLSYSSVPDRQEIISNRKRLASAMKVEPSRLHFPSQVHLTKIVRVDYTTTVHDLSETDALITNQGGVAIAVMSADCVPILLYDYENRAIGAVHSGWRGTVAKILDKVLHRMAETFGTKGDHVIAAIGPSVSQESYEVGGEVIEAVLAAFGKEDGLLIPQPHHKAQLDLWKANKMQLLAFGVPPDQIEVSDLCTVKNNNYFFSARKGDAGRFAAGIVMT